MDKAELSQALEKISNLMSVMNKYVEELIYDRGGKGKKEINGVKISTPNKPKANVTNTTIITSNTVNTIEIRADQMNTNAGYIYAAVNVCETNTRIATVSAIAIR